mmetsp:Transcript_3109/g.7886  ORF Transcript_3109/g.7886 Transcript_3109/m.7886 type:complete len:247 (+) Transcript_3109:930-1670(+)
MARDGRDAVVKVRQVRRPLLLRGGDGTGRVRQAPAGETARELVLRAQLSELGARPGIALLSRRRPPLLLDGIAARRDVGGGVLPAGRNEGRAHQEGSILLGRRHLEGDRRAPRRRGGGGRGGSAADLPAGARPGGGADAVVPVQQRLVPGHTSHVPGAGREHDLDHGVPPVLQPTAEGAGFRPLDLGDDVRESIAGDGYGIVDLGVEGSRRGGVGVVRTGRGVVVGGGGDHHGLLWNWDATVKVMF